MIPRSSEAAVEKPDLIKPVGEDLHTELFSIARIDRRAPRVIADRLADLEVTRSEGKVPIVITTDGIVALYLEDFLSDPGAAE